MTFNIWPTLTGGSIPLWTETWLGASNGVTTTGGLFNVTLGSVLPISLPFDQPYYLEIVWTNSSGTAETMSPRQPLVTAPYAFRATFADNASVTAPLTLSAATAFPNGVLTVSNTGTGSALRAYATKPGALTGPNIDPSTPFNMAIYGYSDQSASAGVMGVNTYAAGSQEAGMVGMGYYTGIFGVAYGLSSTATAGSFQSNGGTGIHVQGQTDGIDAQAALGTAVSGQGVTGVAGYSSSTAGVGVLASTLNGGQALEVLGGARFDTQGGPTSVTFNTDVFFNGVVHGISGSVPNPLLLSSSTITGPVIEGTNTHTGGIGLEGSVNFGTALLALATTGQAIFADSSSSTETAMQIQNDASGDGIDSFAAGLTRHLSGLYGEDDSLSASPNAGFGVTGYSGNGSGVFGESNDNTGGEAAIWGQADASSGPSNGVVGDGSGSNGGTGVWGMGGAYGVYGSTSKGTGYGVYGTNDANGGAIGYGIYGTATGGSQWHRSLRNREPLWRGGRQFQRHRLQWGRGPYGQRPDPGGPAVAHRQHGVGNHGHAQCPQWPHLFHGGGRQELHLVLHDHGQLCHHRQHGDRQFVRRYRQRDHGCEHVLERRQLHHRLQQRDRL